MKTDLPSAVPEIPVTNLDQAAAYYVESFGFNLDWMDEHSGIAGISRSHCRLFLTSPIFRETHRNAAPVVVWLNLNSTDEVDQLHEQWRNLHAKIVSPPKSQPWNLHEFTAADLDGNLLRVFYDFSPK